MTHENTVIVQKDDYYPFGLTFNSYHRPSSVAQNWKFQGQEHIDDLGINWDSFKWRNHQPDLGRFFNVDPLAEDYYYNSPYAFSENKVTAHIELEGLEAVRAPRPNSRTARSGGNLARIRRTVDDAARISKRPSGFAVIGRREGAMFTRRTTYSTNRGNGNNAINRSPSTNVGYEDNLHSFGNTLGNLGKVFNEIRGYTQKLVDNADKIVVTESFTESGIFELSLGADVMVGGIETTMQLSELQEQYNSSVMDIARGDLSPEEFGELDNDKQSLHRLKQVLLHMK